MMVGKNWTKSEIEFLKENYNTTKLSTLSNTIGRSESAITQKAYKIGLQAGVYGKDKISVRALCVALGYGTSSSGYTYKAWKNNGLVIYNVIVTNHHVRMVDLDEFWKWAEKHQDLINFSKFEKYSLGQEPEWVADKRQKDMNVKKNIEWSPMEVAELKSLLRSQCYTLDELSKKLGRTTQSVRSKIGRLKLLDTPLINSKSDVRWTDDELKKLEEWILSDGDIEDYIPGRGSNSIRVKMHRLYGTSSVNQARKIILSRKE